MGNHSHDEHTHQHAIEASKPGLSSSGALWFFLIVAFLFIATVNFVKVMGESQEGGHGGSHDTHAPVHNSHDPSLQPVNETADPDNVTHSDDALIQNAAQADSLIENEDARALEPQH